MFLFQETKSKLESSEKSLKETRKEIKSMWQQLRHMYFALQVTDRFRSESACEDMTLTDSLVCTTSNTDLYTK